MVEIIVAMITGIFTLAIGILNLITNKKNVKKEDLIEQINKVELNNCKNYLVQQISATDRRELSQAEKERYWENYDTYKKLGGNSYIHTATERLKKEGKI